MGTMGSWNYAESFNHLMNVALKVLFELPVSAAMVRFGGDLSDYNSECGATALSGSKS